jgi:hypothetical protein
MSRINDNILDPDTRVIDEFRKLPQLELIDLQGTQLTAEGLESFQRALPHVSITR